MGIFARAGLSTLIVIGGVGLANGGQMSKSDASRQSMELRPSEFSELPGWGNDDHAAALRAFRVSCHRLRSIAQGSMAANKRPSAGLIALCKSADEVDADRLETARLFFEANFIPHRIVHKADHGMLTGYYEPEIEGSRHREGKFQFPVYRRPPDLVNLVDESERGAKSSGPTHVRKTAAGTEPYPTREEIDKGALSGQRLELVWLESPVDAFFMQVQGSGKIKFHDGSSVRLTYDGKNGHAYSSIARYLIDNRIMPADKVSMQALADWLKADVERGQAIMWKNQSYVFFRENTGAEKSNAIGVWDIPLTTGRSLAVDTAYHAIGTPIYVSSPALTHAVKGKPFQRLMVAQDVGSAIKGPERGDIFFGSGERAGQIAGNTKHDGNFYVLLPKADSVRLEQAELSRPKAK